MTIQATPERALSSAADPLPTPFRHLKMHPISAVDALGKIEFNRLIANRFSILIGQFTATRTHFSAVDSGIATALHRRGQADEASGSGLPGNQFSPVPKLACKRRDRPVECPDAGAANSAIRPRS